MPESPDTSPIRASFTPTLEDYHEFMVWCWTRPVMMAGMTTMMVVISMLWAVPYVYRGTPVWQATLPTVGILVMYFVCLRSGLLRVAQRTWDRSPELRAERTFTFAPAGITLVTADSLSEFGWPVVATAVRGAGQYLLRTNLGLFYTLPARAFAPEDVTRFEDLVREMVPGARL